MLFARRFHPVPKAPSPPRFSEFWRSSFLVYSVPLARSLSLGCFISSGSLALLGVSSSLLAR